MQPWMQDVVWFAVITGSVVTVGNVAFKGNRLFIGICLYLAYRWLSSITDPQHLWLAWYGHVGELTLILVATIAAMVWVGRKQTGNREQQINDGIP